MIITGMTDKSGPDGKRTACRLPRIRRFAEAKNIRYAFEEYLLRISEEERQALPVVLSALKLVLLKVLAPKRVAGLGGLMECQGCEAIGATVEGCDIAIACGSP